MTNYISESLSPSEVFRRFGDQVPEFMQSWLEQIVNKAQDLDQMESQSEDYNDLKEEIATLEDQVYDLETENKEYRKLLSDNNIDY